MPSEERMTIDERYKYLRRQQPRYGKADRAEKGRLLDEMEAVTGLHRKSLIRLMAGRPQRRKRRRQRGPSYGPPVRQVVLVVAEATDWVCAERLTASLPWLAGHLERHGEVKLEAGTMARIPWQVGEAGHLEIDLVHHAGRSAEGEYLHTLQLVDSVTSSDPG